MIRIQDSGFGIRGSGVGRRASGFRFLGAVILLVLAGCASAPRPSARIEAPPKEKPAAPVARGGGYYQDDGPGENAPPNIEATPDATPRIEPLHRYANDTYVVLGRTYTPDISGTSYSARGIASWYGRKFHGKRTASGETYDMYGMSAAHTTLPIPSYVRVTNPKTGKAVIVRVNDRGPFHSDRLIDLSYTAAAKLGLIGAGSGPVEVERIDPAAWRPAEPPVAVAAARTEPVVADTDVATYWLQFGAFGVQGNAENMLNRLQSQLGQVGESVRIVAKEGLFRLRAGPFKTATEANDLAAQVKKLSDVSAVVLR
ncbi:MAG: septal ring lytic transglycosylase RlpA family protein [Hydrogenophilales bacterium]|nr:septal ring lytic transglycosylase RlpA family protein [Hydrogenophilales bacterium]